MTRGGNTRKTGARYELLAAVHLEKCGYHIIEKNYRCRIGEIDLVACDGAYLVFVEVFSRAICRHLLGTKELLTLAFEEFTGGR